MNKIEKILKLFREKPYLVKMGAKLISERYDLPVDYINKARNIYHKERKRSKKYNILIFDIETTPLQAYVWSRWKQNVYSPQMISEWFMLCWSAKWLGSEEVMSASVSPKEALQEDDSRISKQLWSLIDQADIVVAHNGDRFDIPKMNTRFMLAGLPQPSPYSKVDTLKVARGQFGFSSNSLDSLAGYFNLNHKDSTSFELWANCLKGDQEALDYMEIYCRNDVRILEQVYIKLRPWIKGHPNLGLYIESNNMVCPSCGSENLEKDDSFHYTKVSKFKIMRCNDCQSIARMRTSSYPKDKRKKLITSI